MANNSDVGIDPHIIQQNLRLNSVADVKLLETVANPLLERIAAVRLLDVLINIKISL